MNDMIPQDDKFLLTTKVKEVMDSSEELHPSTLAMKTATIFNRHRPRETGISDLGLPRMFLKRVKAVLGLARIGELGPDSITSTLYWEISDWLDRTPHACVAYNLKIRMTDLEDAVSDATHAWPWWRSATVNSDGSIEVTVPHDEEDPYLSRGHAEQYGFTLIESKFSHINQDGEESEEEIFDRYFRKEIQPNEIAVALASMLVDGVRTPFGTQADSDSTDVFLQRAAYGETQFA